MRNLDGLTMFLSTTASTGMVSGDTRLHFMQRGARVAARYAGGRVQRGWLVARWGGDVLRFGTRNGKSRHPFMGGESECVVEERPNGRLRLIEHFVWTTRPGSGANVFDEIPQGPSWLPA